MGQVGKAFRGGIGHVPVLVKGADGHYTEWCDRQDDTKDDQFEFQGSLQEHC
jgi:hypothetical protein